MMEIFAFIGAVATSIWTLGILALFVLWLVHENSERWAVFWVAVLGCLAYWTSNVDPVTALTYAALYIPIGVGWSMYRWRRFCKAEVERTNKNMIDLKNPKRTISDIDANLHNDSERNRLENKLQASNNITELVSWIIVWPFSLLENVLGDVYDMIVTLVRKHLINVYTRISMSAMKDLK